MKKHLPYALLVLALLALLFQHNRLCTAQNDLNYWKKTAQNLQQTHIGDSLLLIGNWDAARAHGQTLPPEARSAWLASVDSAEQTHRERSAAQADQQHQRDTQTRLLTQARQAEETLQEQVLELRNTLRLLRDSASARAVAILQLAQQRDNLVREKEAMMSELLDQVSRLTEEVESRSMLRLKSPAGVDILYFGQTQNGKPHGKGIAFYANGNSYDGTWDAGDKHGSGAYTYPKGERYEGGFTRNKRDGLGTYTWPNGDIYRGYWKADTRNGEGVIRNAKGQVLRSGVWQNDKLVQGKEVQL